MIESAVDFVRLRTSPEPADYDRAAREPAPLQVWRDVVREYREMRVWVARNKTIPIEILELLASDPDARVRAAVAEKRKLPAGLQLRLAADVDWGVRERLACNEKATRAALALIAHGAPDAAAERARARLTAGEYIEDRDHVN